MNFLALGEPSMKLLAGMMAAAVAMKREILMGLAPGVLFALVMYLCRPLGRWSASRSQDDVRRLLHSELMQPVSTYVLMGLWFGFQMAGTFVLIPLGPIRPPLERLAVALIGIVLLLFGTVAITLVGTRAAKRLAKQVMELRAAAA